MKNVFAFLFAIIVFASCDYVHFPGQDFTPIDNDTTTDVVQRKVLLEDYTAHKCTSCPAANTIAENLKNLYKKNIVVVSVHAGPLSKPNLFGTDFLADYRTPAGDTYNSFFAVPWNPMGLINRKIFSPTVAYPYCIPKDDWSTQTAIEIAKPANAKLEINNTYYPLNRNLICEVKSTFLHDTITGGPYRLVVMLTQDSIIATQKDGTQTISNYVHQHVLRDNLNGTWGEVISNVPVTKNSPITKTYNYTLKTSYPSGTGGINDTNCNPDHCHIVAFLYNDVTKEVIQVEEKAVTH